ncbi:MAG: peptidoglycan-binding domain-containing protein [Propionicimonas sp.]|nr:peptidoglycan-binding domain-containing protein [Propionicimonas sp.]
MRPSTATVDTHRAGPRRDPAPGRVVVAGVAAMLALGGLAGCGTMPVDPVQAAQANVATKEKALAAARSEASAAEAAFCTAGADYLAALDGYGDVLVQTAPTVGDVRSAGADLVEPREDVLGAADAVRASADEVARAEQELAEAEVALSEAEARAAGQTPSAPAASASPSPSEPAPPASVARVRQAESEFAATSAAITDDTPLREAAQEFNAAAVALELAWLRLFADAGCLTDSQQEKALEAVHDYTVALQQDLAGLGLYEGEVDGIYGPQTVAAVKALQEAHDLPQTGVVDKATEAALRAELVARGGADAADSIASTAALQQTLKLAGYWDGEVDGIWTDELTDALKTLQEDLGVPATGEVDAATIAAAKEAIEQAGEVTPTPEPGPSESPEPSATAEATPTPTPTG